MMYIFFIDAVMVASSPIKSTRSSALNAFANERDAPRSLPQQGNRTSPVKPSHGKLKRPTL